MSLFYDIFDGLLVKQSKNRRAKNMSLKQIYKAVLLTALGLAGLSNLSNYTEAANTTQLSVGYDNSSDYYVHINYTLNGQSDSAYAVDTAFNVSYVSGQPLPNGYTSPFTSFCMYIGADLIANNWTAVPFSTVNTAQLGYSATGLDRAANLYNAYANQVNFSSASGELAGGALQLAIWDVLYGSDLGRVDDQGSAFYVNTSLGNGGQIGSAISLANQFLGSSANNPNPYYQSTFFEATDASGNLLHIKSRHDWAGDGDRICPRARHLCSGRSSRPLRVACGFLSFKREETTSVVSASAIKYCRAAAIFWRAEGKRCELQLGLAHCLGRKSGALVHGISDGWQKASQFSCASRLLVQPPFS